MTEFFVSPEGNDRGRGTHDKPFATVARAQRAVRKLIAAGLREDVTVHIGGGRYELDRPLVFGSQDGGTAKRRVAYAGVKGEQAVLSGGSRITGWRKGKGGVWRATIADVKAGKWYFRQLFIDGCRAVRARMPNEGEYLHLIDADFDAEFTEHLLTFRPGVLKKWRNIEDVEAVMYSHWVVTRKRLTAVDTKHNVAHTQAPHFTGIQRPRPNAPTYLENALEFLDAPGEWYLDRKTGVLTYRPRQGEDMRTAEVVAPRLEQLLRIEGKAGKPVRNLHFRGLRFEHARWQMPPEGHRPIQAGFVFPATAAAPQNQWNKGLWYDDFACVPTPPAIEWAYAHGCSFAGGAVAHTGATGLHLREGCRRNTIEGNEIDDAGCNGIYIGEYWRNVYDHGRDRDIKATMVPTGNRVANNHVHHCAVQLEDGVGIGYSFAAGTEIVHNHLHDLPYTGVSAGFIWTSKPTCVRDNRIEQNHIHDVMLRMADGGAIYTLGYQPGSTMRHNLLHDIPRHPEAIGAPNNGIFMDEGSRGFRIEGNVIYHSAGTPVRHNENLRAWQAWKDNVFVESGEPEPAVLSKLSAGIES